MPILPISSPEKTINGILSNVDASRSQLPYAFQREDFQLLATFDNGGFADFEIDGDHTAEINIGDIIYVQSNVAEDTGRHSVTSVILTVATTRLKTSSPYNANGTIGFVNDLTSRSNYKVGIEIKDENTQFQLIPLIFKYSPDPTGYLFLDLGATLVELHEKDAITSIEYVMRYQESYTGFVSGWGTTPKIQSIYGERQLLDLGGSNMVKYLLTEFGNFPLFVDGSNYVDDGGGFNYKSSSNSWGTPVNLFSTIMKLRAVDISGFQNGKTSIVSIDYQYWYDKDSQNVRIATYDGATWEYTQLQITGEFSSGTRMIHTVEIIDTHANPITLAMIEFGSSVTGVDHQAQIFSIVANPAPQLATEFENPLIWYDFYRSINTIWDANLQARLGGTVNTISLRYLEVDINKGNDITLGYQGVSPTSPAQIHTFDVWGQGKPSEPNSKFIGCYWLENGINFHLSETLYFEIQQPCNQPLYLGWVNSKGGLEEHMFEINQNVQNEAEKGNINERVINADIETVQRTKQRFPNKWTQSIIATASNLKLDQYKALLEIKQSDYLVVYLNKECTKYVYVVVSNGYASEYETGEKLHDFSVQIEFPDNFDVYKAIEY